MRPRLVDTLSKNRLHRGASSLSGDDDPKEAWQTPFTTEFDQKRRAKNREDMSILDKSDIQTKTMKLV
jgi:hypothetical protein